MRLHVAGLAAVFLGWSVGFAAVGAALAHESTSKGVTVAHPWARATPGGSSVGVAFMEIKTEAGVADRLVTVASPVAGRVEIHTHIMDGDVMKMRRVDSVELKPGESHILKPGGEHVMLFDLKKPLKEGDLVALSLTFEKAGVIEVEGTVEPVGATGPHGMDHQPGTDDEKSSAGQDSGGSKEEHNHGAH
ncbi:MAG: copper chaperone PCu(A)C [Hyphomicrobium sp.]